MVGNIASDQFSVALHSSCVQKEKPKDAGKLTLTRKPEVIAKLYATFTNIATV